LTVRAAWAGPAAPSTLTPAPNSARVTRTVVDTEDRPRRALTASGIDRRWDRLERRPGDQPELLAWNMWYSRISWAMASGSLRLPASMLPSDSGTASSTPSSFQISSSTSLVISRGA
jgi:hypothetical protein